MNYLISSPYIGAFVLAIILSSMIYSLVGWRSIGNCLSMFFRRSYWTNYNIVEFLAWAAKAAVIVPGLVFGLEIWQLHIATLFTSAALIWASMKKLLPTLVAFNTLWIFLSMTVIFRHLAGL